jgi:hypothetical protein
VGEDHAAAAVALETDGVESVTGRKGISISTRERYEFGAGVGFEAWSVRIWCSGLLGARRNRDDVCEYSLPLFHFLGEELHVFLPEVTNDLCDSQYAPRLELRGVVWYLAAREATNGDDHFRVREGVYLAGEMCDRVRVDARGSKITSSKRGVACSSRCQRKLPARANSLACRGR